MNERLQQLKQRAAASSKSTQATLQRTAPKATLGGIKSIAEKRFGQRKPTKKQNQPKKTQPKKTQPKPKSVSSRPLEQWEQAMRKANIPAHRWRKLQDKISRLSGAERTEIEKELFNHEMFKDVYSVGEDDPSIVDDYLTDLEDKVNELTAENVSLVNMVDDVNDFIQENPTLGAVVVTYVIGGNTMNFKATQMEDGSYVFEDENGTMIAGLNSTELDETERSLIEDTYKVMNMPEDGLKPFKPMSPEDFKKALEEFNKNNNKLD